jgi:hypothetical protein
MSGKGPDSASDPAAYEHGSDNLLDQTRQVRLGLVNIGSLSRILMRRLSAALQTSRK